jgi:hypothetical protein
MWLVVPLTETTGLAMATTLLPELMVLVASSLLLIFFLASFFVLGMVFRKASWAAIERWQEARKKRIVFTNEIRTPHPISSEERVSRKVFEFGGGVPTSTSPQWSAVVKPDSFARHV